ncbi:hypothetical protein [Streptomyces sp. bgisy031]|uniref:hypothetical protein n=1 Tax=Streptomyces sp. bgisy031 TaxID=3413772 RepID=UPI003D723E3C
MTGRPARARGRFGDRVAFVDDIDMLRLVSRARLHQIVARSNAGRRPLLSLVHKEHMRRDDI